MSLPAPPKRRSEPWWPSSSSLSGPPTFLCPPLSSTFHRIPVTAGQPLCGTLSPPPLVLRPLPGPHCTPAWRGAHRSTVEPRRSGTVLPATRGRDDERLRRRRLRAVDRVGDPHGDLRRPRRRGTRGCSPRTGAARSRGRRGGQGRSRARRRAGSRPRESRVSQSTSTFTAVEQAGDVVGQQRAARAGHARPRRLQVEGRAGRRPAPAPAPTAMATMARTTAAGPKRIAATLALRLRRGQGAPTHASRSGSRSAVIRRRRGAARRTPRRWIAPLREPAADRILRVVVSGPVCIRSGHRDVRRPSETLGRAARQ